MSDFRHKDAIAQGSGMYVTGSEIAASPVSTLFDWSRAFRRSSWGLRAHSKAYARLV
jgi:hypothetical protein